MQIGSRQTGKVVKIVATSGGSGYTAPPTVAISGGGGTGAVAYAHMAGTVVQSIHIQNGGTGYTGSPSISFSGGGGTGAAATAYAYTGPLRPITLFKGRYGTLYGVDGMGRGIRLDASSSSVDPIGLAKPAVGPAITAVSASSANYVRSVQLIGGGAGYSSEPTVVFTGGTPTQAAEAKASIAGGRVVGVTVTNGGRGYQSAPVVTFSGGMGAAVQLTVGVSGRASTLSLSAAGSGYTTSIPVTAATSSYEFAASHHGLSAGSSFTLASFTGGSGLSEAYTYYAVSVGAHTFTAGLTAASTAATSIFSTDITAGSLRIPPARMVFDSSRGLTGANARVFVGPDGGITAVELLSGGTGATTTGVTAAIVGGGGSGGAVSVGMEYGVAAVTVASAGIGYFVAPVITFRAASQDTTGTGAAATASVNGSGGVASVTVTAAGRYSQPPTALVLDTQAVAQAELSPPLRGKYRCCIRYVDGTTPRIDGPLASSISHLVTVEATAGSLTWSFAHYGLDDRVQAMELWRTTADQSVLLFKVAEIPRSSSQFTGTYTDTLSDQELKDATRTGYALMPVTLPSGQINARRFEIPPGEFAVACMFQDRAWYAVDTAGESPNSLFYSEIDEPESVPIANEIVVQENAGESDRLVALIPLGGALLLAQQHHLYKLTYVAQPVIDASILLAAHRGVLNGRCWDLMGGVAFIVDSVGMYAFDGSKEESLSVAVDNYWRDGVIDFTQSSSFHVRADLASKTVRFFYCKSGESAPARALCYSIATQAWWEETFPTAITATCAISINGQRAILSGTANGTMLKHAGVSDSGAAIPYAIRTGAMPLAPASGDRSITVVYDPTASDNQLNLRLHYNNSSTPRSNAVSTDRGGGFTTAAGNSAAQLNMKVARSALGDATGVARAQYAGRFDERSAGADRHMAVALDGTQATTGGPVTIHGISVEGAG